MRHLNENYSDSTNVAVLSTVIPSEMGQIFSYNGNNVRMRKMDGYIIVCLTDFAKPFPDKNLSHIVNSKEISDYVARMSEIQNCSSVDLLQVRKGGDVKEQGTWAHHRVAIRVAQKLSTDFAIWVDNKIEELLTTGHTSIQPQYNIPQSFSEALQLAADQAKQIEKQRQLIEFKEDIIDSQEKELVSVQPKIAFAECIMKSSDCISVGDMANILNQNQLFNKGKISFYRWLRYNGYLIQRGIRYNHPSQKSMKNNLMRLVEVPYTTRGMVAFNTISMITPYGQKYFINLFRKMRAGEFQPELLFEK